MSGRLGPDIFRRYNRRTFRRGGAPAELPLTPCESSGGFPAVFLNGLTHFPEILLRGAGRESSGKCLKQYLRTFAVSNAAPPEKSAGILPDF